MARGTVTGPLLVQVVLCLVITILLYLYWSLSGQLRSCQQAEDSLSSDHEALITRVDELTRDLQSARDVLGACQKSKRDALAQLDELQIELKSTETRLSDVEDKLKDCQEETSSAKDEAQRLVDEVDKHKAKWAECDKARADKDSEHQDVIAELQGRVATAETQVHNLQQDKSSLAAQLSELGDRSQATESQLQQCQYQMKELQQQQQQQQQQRANPPYNSLPQDRFSQLKEQGAPPNKYPPHVQQLDRRNSDDSLLKRMPEGRNSYSLARDSLGGRENLQGGQPYARNNVDNRPVPQGQRQWEHMNLEEGNQLQKGNEDGAAADGQSKDRHADTEPDQDSDAINDSDEDEDILKNEEEQNLEGNRQEDDDDYDEDRDNAEVDPNEDEKQQRAPETIEKDVHGDVVEQNSRNRGDM